MQIRQHGLPPHVLELVVEHYPLEPAGTAVRLGNVALGWRGPYLVRLSYTNSAEPSAERAQSADTLFRGVLQQVARALNEGDPGSVMLPRAVG